MHTLLLHNFRATQYTRCGPSASCRLSTIVGNAALLLLTLTICSACANTSLETAILAHDSDAVRELLEHRHVNPNSKITNAYLSRVFMDETHSMPWVERTPPIVLACREGDLDTTALLLQAGADPNAENSFHHTALYYAAGDAVSGPELCRLLLAHGAELRRGPDGDNIDVLLVAVWAGSPGYLVELLDLALNENPDLDWDALRMCVRRKFPDPVVLYVLTVAENMTPSELREDNHAVQRHIDEQVGSLLAGANRTTAIPLIMPAGADEMSLTPLMLAASRFGDASIVRSLLEGGAAPNEVLWCGWTALWFAVEGSKADSMKALIQYGADPNCGRAEPDEEPLLLWATMRSSYQVLKELVDAGADPKAETRSGRVAADVIRFNPTEDKEEISRLLSK